MDPSSELPASDKPKSHSDALDSILIVIEGPGDTTRRPRHSIPYTPPEDIPPSPKKRKKDKPVESPKDGT